MKTEKNKDIDVYAIFAKFMTLSGQIYIEMKIVLSNSSYNWQCEWPHGYLLALFFFFLFALNQVLELYVHNFHILQ
jgi:hypothetical protein